MKKIIKKQSSSKVMNLLYKTSTLKFFGFSKPSSTLLVGETEPLKQRWMI